MQFTLGSTFSFDPYKTYLKWTTQDIEIKLSLNQTVERCFFSNQKVQVSEVLFLKVLSLYYLLLSDVSER